MIAYEMFRDYLERWTLTPDGDPVIRRGSRLLPVRLDDVPAMLKVATHPEERLGGLLMAWWDGQGAARILARDGDALLMERAEGGRSLADFARNGRDGEASRIICATVAELHKPRPSPVLYLVPLERRFEPLEPAARTHGGMMRLSAATASSLLAEQQDVVVLHGDIHHGNILDFGPRGWRAIDPKGLRGERGFDYANLFCNPDGLTVTAPNRLASQVALVAALADLDRGRLLRWTLAWAGLRRHG